ncbi:MAG: GntR family transcriptional regulator [Acidimicrobiales bacterium]
MAEPDRRSIVRVSLADQVTESLRHMILTGEFRSGQHLTHDELAKRLGVSTMPVREALLRLSHEGFVDMEPNRAFRVTPMTRSDIEDIYWAHATLAGELTARACRQDRTELLTELEEIQSAWLASGTTARPEQLEVLNYRFHRAINRASASPRIIRLLSSTVRLIPEHFYALVPEWRGVSTTGHVAIIEAIRDRAPERARKAASAHVLEAGSLLVEHFTDTGFWAEPKAPH